MWRLVVAWAVLCLLTGINAVPHRVFPPGQETAGASHVEQKPKYKDPSKAKLDFSLLNSLVEEEEETHENIGGLMRFRATAEQKAETKAKATIAGMPLTEIDEISDRAVKNALRSVGMDKPIEDEKPLKLYGSLDRFVSVDYPVHRPPDWKPPTRDSHFRFRDISQNREKTHEKEHEKAHEKDHAKAAVHEAPKKKADHNPTPRMLDRGASKHRHHRHQQGAMGPSFIQTEVNVSPKHTHGTRSRHHPDKLARAPGAADVPDTTALAETDSVTASHSILDHNHGGRKDGMKRDHSASSKTSSEDGQDKAVPEDKPAEGPSTSKPANHNGFRVPNPSKQPPHHKLWDAVNKHADKLGYHASKPFADIPLPRFEELHAGTAAGEGQAPAFEYTPSPFKHPPPPPVPPPPPPPPPPNFGPGSEFSGYKFGTGAPPTAGNPNPQAQAASFSSLWEKKYPDHSPFSGKNKHHQFPRFMQEQGVAPSFLQLSQRNIPHSLSHRIGEHHVHTEHCHHAEDFLNAYDKFVQAHHPDV